MFFLKLRGKKSHYSEYKNTCELIQFLDSGASAERVTADSLHETREELCNDNKFPLTDSLKCKHLHGPTPFTTPTLHINTTDTRKIVYQR